MPAQGILGSVVTGFLNVSLDVLSCVMLNWLDLNLAKRITSILCISESLYTKIKNFTHSLSHRQKD